MSFDGFAFACAWTPGAGREAGRAGTRLLRVRSWGPCDRRRVFGAEVVRVARVLLVTVKMDSMFYPIVKDVIAIHLVQPMVSVNVPVVILYNSVQLHLPFVHYVQRDGVQLVTHQ